MNWLSSIGGLSIELSLAVIYLFVFIMMTLMAIDGLLNGNLTRLLMVFEWLLNGDWIVIEW